MSRTPAFAQASTMARASAALVASGFSHSTCLPAAAARSTYSRCMALGSTTYTACTCGFSRTRSKSA